MDKIMKNKEAKEMGIENMKGLEKDEDQLALQEDEEQDVQNNLYGGVH